MVTLMRRTAPDRTGYAKKVLSEDEDLIFELADIHDMSCTEIADKFEICPRYLRDWLRNKTTYISKNITRGASGKYSRAQV